MKVAFGATKSAGDALVAADRWQDFSSHGVSELRTIQRAIETFLNAPPEPIKVGDDVVLWSEYLGSNAEVIGIRGPFVEVSDGVRDFWVPWYNCKTTRNDAS